jgi:hypothetical protein
MPAYLAPRLEFSPDALSVTSPTYTDVTSYVMSATWGNGDSRRSPPPQREVKSLQG